VASISAQGKKCNFLLAPPQHRQRVLLKAESISRGIFKTEFSGEEFAPQLRMKKTYAFYNQPVLQ
jgi:hypothetical protein